MKKLLVILTFILCFATTLAHADGPDDDSFVQISATGRYIGSADFEDSNGGVQVTSGQLAVEVGDFSFEYTGDKYSWDNKRSLPFGNGSEDPWDALHKLSLEYELGGGINDSWGYSVGLSVSSAFEKEMSGSFGAAFRAGFQYSFNENWNTMFGGMIAMDSLETDIMPYLGVMYENYDADGSGTFMTLGLPGSEAGYAFNESNIIRASFELAGDTYRLKDDSTVARKGYVETSSMLTGLYYDWKPTESFSLSLGPEYHFGREMQIYNEDGNKVGSAHEQDSAWGARLQFRYEF